MLDVFGHVVSQQAREEVYCMHCNRRIAACRSAPTQLVACAVILGNIAGPFPVQHTAKIHADALRMVCMLSVGLLPGAECLLQWS